jgi:integrase
MTQNERRVQKAVICVWSEHRPSSQREIAGATQTKKIRALSQPTIRYYFRKWEEDERMETQVSEKGQSGAAWYFSWGAPASATLRDAVEFALRDGTLPDGTRRHVRTGIRIRFGLPDRCSDTAILEACDSVSADQLYDLPEGVYEACLEKTDSKRTAQNLRSAMRRALRLAAQANVVPVVFPRIWAEDVWEAAKWAYFPLDAPGLKNSTISTYRCHWQKFAEESKALFGGEISPDQITPDMVDRLQRHLITKKGKRHLARQIQTILSYVGRQYGVGPLADKWSDPDLAIGYNGRVNAGYLVDANGRAASNGNWDTFLGILRDSGFPNEWQEFFGWYNRYSTLPEEQIELDENFPERPDKRELTQRTLVKRIVAVRAWGYQAIHTLQELEGVGPADITLEMAFGTHGRAIARRLRAWWAERAARGEVSDRTSDGLVGILKGGMMIARALYEKSRHERGFAVVGKDKEARRVIEEEEVRKTPGEEALWQTYLVCRRMMDSLEKQRRESSNGHVSTTSKDIRRIIEQTPPTYWEGIQFELLRRIREAKGTATDEGFRYHRLVLLAFLLGLMISTGFRISEVSHIRLGIQANGNDRQYSLRNRKERRIRLRACDRKNRRRHSAFLRERYCPLWLEEEYLEQSRPFFLRWGNAPEHDWVVVDGKGLPYGCLEEDDDGGGRDDIAHSERLGKLRDFWIDQLMGVAADLGFEIPYDQGEFAPHVIRNVFGYMAYQTWGEEACASYLGDRVPSVRETYASCDGVNVNISAGMNEGLSLIKREAAVAEGDKTTGQEPLPTPDGYSGELTLLMKANAQGLINEAQLRQVIADLNRRYESTG